MWTKRFILSILQSLEKEEKLYCDLGVVDSANPNRSTF